jgi:hypothetical protein
VSAAGSATAAQSSAPAVTLALAPITPARVSWPNAHAAGHREGERASPRVPVVDERVLSRWTWCRWDAWGPCRSEGAAMTRVDHARKGEIRDRIDRAGESSLHGSRGGVPSGRARTCQ